MSTGGEPAGFEVTFAAGVIDKLRGFVRRADRLGIGPEFRAALRLADRELRTRPREWGDPVHNLPVAALAVYHRLTPLLVFRYAVHTSEPFVFVRGVTAAPNSRLA